MELSMKKSLVVLFSLILLINFTSAYAIYVRPLDAGALQPSTAFIYEFNFSTNAACTNIVLSELQIITTDAYGIGFLDIDISTMSEIPSYVCEYKDGTLRAIHELSDAVFRDIYANDITVKGIICDSTGCIGAGVNSSWNETFANTLYADIKWGYNQTQDANTYTDATNVSMTNWIDATFLKILDFFTKLEIVNMIFGNLTEAKTYTNTVISGNESGWLSTYNVTYSDGVTRSSFVNYTNIKTTGNIANGSLVGYAAGTAICNYEIAGSHMCLMDEVLEAQNNNNYENFTATFRVSEGAPGYTASAADCEGWKDDTTSFLGAIWVGNNVDGGAGALVSCSAERAIGCCK